jgi:signal transduction histidine kinase
MAPESLPLGSESWIGDFSELVATAIANAQARIELTASRARLVATGDEVRRRIERDLHDGIQQRLVTLALELRGIVEDLPAGYPRVSAQASAVAGGLREVLDELRELSRGIHPAVLSEGGLRPALKSLVRRSSVPVEFQLGEIDRLPERVEVAAYYAASEALTNVAKHANASVVHLELGTRDGRLRLEIRDDGIGGADPAGGSGLLGLTDRVEALGGMVTVTSPPGQGTAIVIELP